MVDVREAQVLLRPETDALRFCLKGHTQRREVAS